MLKQLCNEQSKTGNRLINALLFAYREVPRASSGFSSFEPLCDCTGREPMTNFKELWTGKIKSDDVKISYQHVLELRERLEKTMKLALKN